jgi:hypothetical protein
VAPECARPPPTPASVLPDPGTMFYSSDGTISIVLPDPYDPDYEPTARQIADYARWMGMDPVGEATLLWIAREGLKAPLPEHWLPCRTNTGDVYYFNFATGESLWDHPMDVVYKKLYVAEKAKLRPAVTPSVAASPSSSSSSILVIAVPTPVASLVPPAIGEMFLAPDGTRSTVLADHCDPHFEPTDVQVHEYAAWLGIDCRAEPDLLRIAREGLQTPLPAEWRPCRTDTDDVYFFNFATGESMWDHPVDELCRKLIAKERDHLLRRRLLAVLPFALPSLDSNRC